GIERGDHGIRLRRSVPLILVHAARGHEHPVLGIQLRDRIARMLRMTRQIDDTAPRPTSDFVVGIVPVTIRRDELNPGGRFPSTSSKTRDAMPPLECNTCDVASEKTRTTEQQDVHVVSLA